MATTMDSVAIDHLWNFELRVSDDSVKTDLELIHDACGEHLCDAEHGDTLAALVNVAFSHLRECPSDPIL